ncbi:hypothetical protein ACM742_19790 [Pseudomonas aeruginosa]
MDFSLFRTLIGNKISQSQGSSQREFKAWIASGKYQVTNITSDEVELYILDHDFLAESLGYDFARFTCAAVESLRNISEDIYFPKATAWAGIRSYYSSFFAAHATLRLFGTSCSQIEPQQASLLNRYASQIYGLNGKIPAGFYAGEFNSQKNTLKLKKLSETHKDTWTIFNKKLSELSQSILTVPGLTKSKQEISTFLSQLSTAITDQNKLSSGNWLSMYRNNLNYKQQYDAWFPYKKNSVKFKQLEKYINSWHSSKFNPNIGLLETDERLRFFGTCAAITHLLKGLSADLSSISPQKSIHRTTTEKLIKLTKV